jgi:hypothetical protein
MCLTTNGWGEGTPRPSKLLRALLPSVRAARRRLGALLRTSLHLGLVSLGKLLYLRLGLAGYDVGGHLGGQNPGGGLLSP